MIIVTVSMFVVGCVACWMLCTRDNSSPWFAVAAWVAFSVALGTANAARPWRDIINPLSNGVSVCIQPVYGATDAGARVVSGYQARVAACVASTSPKEAQDCTDVLVPVPVAKNATAKAALVWGLTQAGIERDLLVSTEGLP